MKILLETESVLFAEKPAGMLSEVSGDGQDIVSLLSNELSCPVYPVHRLDRAVGGVMAFAKTKEAAARLSLPCALDKEYIAVVHGETPPDGEWRDLLFKDSRANKSYVVKRMRRGVREAVLRFRTLGTSEGFSLVSVTLLTGRSHQIRVQFSSRRHPLVGDGKYGASDGCAIALYSRKLTSLQDGVKLEASSLPDISSYPWNLFDLEKIFSEPEE